MKPKQLIQTNPQNLQIKKKEREELQIMKKREKRINEYLLRFTDWCRVDKRLAKL
jgi:hypothetical protein